VDRKQVVLVCMVDSIHVARWLKLFVDEKVDFFLFPSGPNRRIHPQIRELIRSNPDQMSTVKILNFGGALSLPLWALDLIFRDKLRSSLLRGVIRRVKPAFVHALEFQHGGYLAEKALSGFFFEGEFIATNYGSDIYWFQKFPSHLLKIRRLLGRADRYSAECLRDYKLAKTHGFKGLELPLIPNSGLLGAEELAKNRTPSSLRNTLAVKGYQGWVGRAGAVIDALSKYRDEFHGVKIVFFSSNAVTLFRVLMLRLKTRLDVQAIRKNKLSHSEVLDLLSESRVYVGASLSDGLSTSSIEAMAMGAFPLQSDTACSSEWFLHGHTGQSMESLNPEYLAKLILETFMNTSRLESARRTNLSIVSERYRHIDESQGHISFYNL
jgi:hypothetical protein